jgi:hypothetical protein
MEEAAFIQPEVWTEVVIPLMGVRDTGLAAISTPLDESNYYSSLINKTDGRGERIFEVLEARAACQACIETLADPSKCPHVQLDVPSWKSKEKQQVERAMFGGDQSTMLRESFGIITQDQDGVFMRKRINRMFERERNLLPMDVRHVYVAIDPTGGGPSKFAIVSGILHQGQLQVRVDCRVDRRVSSRESRVESQESRVE